MISIADVTDESPFLYEERQRFDWSVYVVLTIFAIKFSGMAVALWYLGQFGFPGIALVLLAMTTLLALNFLYLVVRVDSNDIRISLGFLFPMFWKSIPLSDIRELRVITYRSRQDADGWAMNSARFEWRRALYWRTRGKRGVLVVTPMRRVALGSQQPEALCAAIERARKIEAQASLEKLIQ